jgi:hypothetical protein
MPDFCWTRLDIKFDSGRTWFCDDVLLDGVSGRHRMLVRRRTDRWLAYPCDWSGWEVARLCGCADNRNICKCDNEEGRRVM